MLKWYLRRQIKDYKIEVGVRGYLKIKLKVPAYDSQNVF